MARQIVAWVGGNDAQSSLARAEHCFRSCAIDVRSGLIRWDAAGEQVVAPLDARGRSERTWDRTGLDQVGAGMAWGDQTVR